MPTSCAAARCSADQLSSTVLGASHTAYLCNAAPNPMQHPAATGAGCAAFGHHALTPGKVAGFATKLAQSCILICCVSANGNKCGKKEGKKAHVEARESERACGRRTAQHLPSCVLWLQVALVGGVPRSLGFKQCLQHFLDFR